MLDIRTKLQEREIKSLKDEMRLESLQKEVEEVRYLVDHAVLEER